MKDNQKSFSDSWRNPAMKGAFNAQPHVTPQALDPAKREAANDARAALVKDTKERIAPFTSQNVSEPAAHESWLNFVNDRLRGLEDC